MKWFQRKPKRHVCGVCSRVTFSRKPEVCGTAKVERQEFPDGSWVEWRSWVPCSNACPGGVKSASYALDEVDLGEVRRNPLGVGGEVR